MADHVRDSIARKLRVFLCHASEDKPVVRDIYQRLRACNIDPWLDEKDLLPGENWEILIPEVIHKCDIILLCLSRTFLRKEGYGNYELRVILEAAKRKPFNTIYHIPYRLDDCEIPSVLAGIHYASNFVPEDFEKLLLACEKRREWLNATQELHIEPVGKFVSEEPVIHLEVIAVSASEPENTLPVHDEREDVLSKGGSVHMMEGENLRVEHFDIPTPHNPIGVFLSYAHEDEWLLSQLEAHLSGLKREGLISTWCDRQIMPGSCWAGIIDQHLEEASLILLLVSSDFLNSDYCYEIEIKRALELHQAGKSRVIPLIMRPTDWKKTPLAHLRALPGGDQPVTSWSDPDQAFLDIAFGIRRVVEELTARPRSQQAFVQPASESRPSAPFFAEVSTQEGAGHLVYPEVVVEQHQAGMDTAPPPRPGFSRQQSIIEDAQIGEEIPAAWPGPAGEAQDLRDAPQQSPGVQEPRHAVSPSPSTQETTPSPGDARLARPRPGARFGAPFPRLWNVPRRHSLYFTGRTPLLEQIYHTFCFANEAGVISPQAITGLGGMGKTQVAAEYGFRFRDAYEAVLWVNAESRESLLADFRTIANLLECPPNLLEEPVSLLQTMREWFRSQSKWLLIFDNADNPALVDPFIPRAARGHILTTSRAGAVAEWASRPLNLEALSGDAGAQCILRRSGLLGEQQQLKDVSHAELEAAYRLTELMKGLPLALEQAGAYINDTGCGIRRYLTLYEKYRARIQGTIYGEELREYSESIPSVWKISRSMVEQSNPAAAELLCLCAFLASEKIPDELLFRGASALGPVLGPVADDELRLEQAISVLKRYSLLDREVDREVDLTSLSIHRIMQELLIDEMDEPTRRLWAERAVCATELALASLPDSWPLLQAHARRCQHWIKQWQMRFPAAQRLLEWIAKFA